MEARFLEQRDDRNFLLQQHIALQTASAIAHEINQPLTAISAYSEVALHSMESDTGFDRKTAERIFEPFFTTKSRGVGMVLAISRSLIEANGRQLWHDINAGSGVVIHFTLPLAA